MSRRAGLNMARGDWGQEVTFAIIGSTQELTFTKIGSTQDCTYKSAKSSSCYSNTAAATLHAIDHLHSPAITANHVGDNCV